MTDSTDDRLSQLLDELGTLPLPELMVEATRLILGSEPGNQRMRQAVKGAYAAQKALYYLEVLRKIEQERAEQSRAIKQLLETPGHQRLAAELAASARAGVQEVWGHLWISCVHSIGRLFPLAAKGSGVRLGSDQRSVFENYEPLRHFFEHSDQQVGNPRFEGDVHTELESQNQWQLQIGVRQDSAGHIVIRNWKTNQDHVVDVSASAVQTIQSTVASVWEAMRTQCLDNVRKQFEHDPNSAPSVDEVDWSPLARASRPADWANPPSTTKS